MIKYVNGKEVKLTESEIEKLGYTPSKKEDRDKDKLSDQYKFDRKAAYPNIGEQLDAVLKQFTMMRMDGIDLTKDLDSIVGQWLAVKKKFPKPEGTDGEKK